MASTMMTLARHAASTALNGAALVLAGTAKAVEVAADRVRPRPGAAAPKRPPTREEPPRFEPTVVGPAPAEPPPAPERLLAPEPPPATSRPPAMRPDASRVEELAERPAAQVVEEIGGLSTEELRLLLDHEQAHKRRKTVLRAIERAGAEHARR